MMASDVFTVGLMLYELLAGEHPYWRDDQAEYAELVRAYAAKPPALLGTMPPPALNAEVSAALHRCLSPDPAARPTAVALADVLSGRRATVTPPPKVVAAVAGHPLASAAIELVAPGGRALQIGVRTELGKALVRQFGADGEFWDARQCVIERPAGRPWMISPVPGTANETLVNGKTLVAAQPLSQGDQIAVGRQAKGVVKLPLTVRARG